MFVAKQYLETRFNKIFKKGDIVPDEIAEYYMQYVEKKGDEELLVETPSDVTVEIKEEKPSKKSKKSKKK